MLKKILSIALAVLMLTLALAGCAKEAAPSAEPSTQPSALPETPDQPEVEPMKAGTYTAVCHGFYGDFEVSVTVSETAITQIVPGEYKETEAVGGKAIALMSDSMIESNTSGVDIVSGATVTSAVFRSAVTDCLTQAGAPTELTAPPAAPAVTEETIDTDVLVIGAGASGFAASITAAQSGAKVTLIEKQDIVGGSTVVSAGIVYAALDEADESKMVDYYMERAENNANFEMLTTFAENSLDTISFLEEAGVLWMMSVPAGTAPEARARFSMHEDGTAMIGSALINPLEAQAIRLGVDIYTGVKATNLLQENGTIVGAKATSKTANYTINAKAVILATGGFDASAEMVAKYSPMATGDVVLSNKGNVGEGITMGIEVGAASEFKGGMIGFQSVDGSLPESGYNSEAMGSPLFVQADGTFISLSNDYPITYSALKASGASAFYGIYDAAGAESVQRSVDSGFGFKAETVEELATAAGMDAANLSEAIGKAQELQNGPYFAIVVRPTTIGSMGGLVTNAAAEVLNENDEVIPGLYAAGEVANSAFYYQEYPASGSSNCIGLTFGRIAGENAAAFIAE